MDKRATHIRSAPGVVVEGAFETRRVARRTTREEAAQARASIKEATNFEKAPETDIKAPRTVAETDIEATRTVAETDIEATRTVAETDNKAPRTVAETDNRAPQTVAKTEIHRTEVTTLEVTTKAAAAEQQAMHS